ncbi:MAG TPA: hypothetical protein VHP36_08645, partial [Chitinispirillaceae bacterium]|nr:hypothetical protein [Chitinispirillaceae bacterium]
SAAVISAGYKAQISFSKAAYRENDKSLLQRDLMTICDMLEKDIRMAGLALPGNGIDLTLSDSTSDQLAMFVNKNQLRAKLNSTVSYSDTKILIEHTGMTGWGKWVCLEAGTVVFKEIDRVGVSSSSNPDTIYLTAPLNAGPYTVASTNLYSADRIGYRIKKGTENVLLKRINNKDIGISGLVDSLAIIPKDKSGVPISSGDSARVISIVIGGHIGRENNTCFLAESTEVNIRNVN